MIEVLEKYETEVEDWFSGVLTHTQAHFREGRLGTIIELEVQYIIMGLYMSVELIGMFSTETLWQFFLLNYRFHTLISTGMMYVGTAVIIFGMQEMRSKNMQPL